MSCYHDNTFIPEGTQVSRLGTDLVHPMEFLIAAALTCADVSRLVDRAEAKRDLSPETKQEIVEMYQIHLTEAVGLECTWDANVD